MFLLRIYAVGFLLILCNADLFAQQTIPLYTGEVPNSKGTNVIEAGDSTVRFKVSVPTLTIFPAPADKANNIGIIVVPGGGYGAVVIKHEGYDIAKELNKLGYTAFVLKYRLPGNDWMQNKSIGPLQDAQQAIKLVRLRTAEWNVASGKIGIMGFSAGGHLASTAATHFSTSYISNTENVNLRPDFVILGYPVISFKDSLVHKGSRDNLLGENPPAELVREFSNEEQVNSNTPPAFLIHTQNDNVVDVRNSLVFYEALTKNKVPAELHIYPKGPHGFGANPPFDFWIPMCSRWIQSLYNSRP